MPRLMALAFDLGGEAKRPAEPVWTFVYVTSPPVAREEGKLFRHGVPETIVVIGEERGRGAVKLLVGGSVLSTNWDRTLAVLEGSGNRAAQLLLAHMVLHAPPLQAEAALTVILAHKDRRAIQLLVSRFDQVPLSLRPRIKGLGEELGFALREAYLSAEDQPYRNACDLILELPAYDQISLILGSIHHESPRRRDAEHLIRQLADGLAAELDGQSNKGSRADMERVRQQFLSALEPALGRYAHHKLAVIPETYLLLADDQSELVKKILLEPNQTAHAPMIDAIRTKPVARFGRWIWNALRWRHTPPALLQTIAHRRDAWFRTMLLDRINDLADPAIAQSIRRLREFSWMSPRVLSIRSLPEQQQKGIVILASNSGVSLDGKLDIIARTLAEGHPAARQAAACALLPLTGQEANGLLTRCLEDSDPLVQWSAIEQLKIKHIPHLLPVLLTKLDHIDPRVRAAAREVLSVEYNFDKYVKSFDQLDDRSKVSLGQLIGRIDFDVDAKLRQYLLTEHRTHRIRGAQIVESLGWGDRFWRELLLLVNDDDLIVRRRAIDAIATATSEELIDHLLALETNERDGLRVAEVLAALRNGSPSVELRRRAAEVLESSFAASGPLPQS
jgi:hypothetical protein